MKQGTMKILFFVLKTKLLKNGEAPILMRITINGQYEETRIQRSVPLKLWNAAKGCSKGKDRASNELNSYLSELATRALEKYKELILEQAISTPSLILKRVFGKDTEMRTLLGAIRQEIKEMEKVVNIDYAPVTITQKGLSDCGRNLPAGLYAAQHHVLLLHDGAEHRFCGVRHHLSVG